MSDPSASFGAPPVVFQPSVPFAPAGPGGRRTGLIAAGALILITGVAAGIVMIAASNKNYEDSVRNLARAPVGCVTSLRFDQSGTFTVYVETVGSIGEVRGDCSSTEDDFEFSDDDLPDVDVVLQNEAGETIDLDRDSGKDYDAGGSVGRSIATVQIDEPGDYDMTVTSDDDDFAIAIGKNPKASADTLKGGGGLAFLAGVLVGGLLLLLGLRRRRPPPAAVVPSSPYGTPQSFDPGLAGVPKGPTVSGWPPAPPVPPTWSPTPAPERIAPPTWQPAPPTVRQPEPTEQLEPTEQIERPTDPPPGPPSWPAPPAP